MQFWVKILEEIKNGHTICLMVVLESQGSSPGRQGFKMMITSEGKMNGSIGGGFMEHKLVELSKSLLQKGSFVPMIKKQIHRKEAKRDQSGMICSGEQTIGFYSLDSSNCQWIDDLLETLKKGENGNLEFNQKSVNFSKSKIKQQLPTFQFNENGEWSYKEQPGLKNNVYIIGGGHVGLALSKTMRDLDFVVHIFDDRPDLNTMQNNTFAHHKAVINYEEIASKIPEGPFSYVVLMSFGYRPDELILRQLLGKGFRYFGVMGSKAKMKTLLSSLEKEGFSKENLAKLHTPIGIPIQSKTPAEIAISIAAEIIKVRSLTNAVVNPRKLKEP